MTTKATDVKDAVIDLTKGVSIKDSLNREIVLKRPHILEKMRFEKAVGSVMGGAFNLLFIANTASLVYIHSIDGQLCPIPDTETAINALIGRLDYEGMEAVEAGVEKYFPQAKVKKQEDEAELKNS